MMKNMNILMVGVGGQGIILASDILSKAAMTAGLDSKKSEIHGMSQRGGSVFSHVRYGAKVHSPVIPFGSADVLLSLEKMETLRWLDYTHPETRVIFVQQEILPADTKDYPAGIEEELKNRFAHLTVINPEELVKKIGKPKFVNTALLGAVSQFTAFSEEVWKKAIADEVPEGTFEENWNAFKAGRELK